MVNLPRTPEGRQSGATERTGGGRAPSGVEVASEAEERTDADSNVGRAHQATVEIDGRKRLPVAVLELVSVDDG
jgi:hypothetical protein